MENKFSAPKYSIPKSHKASASTAISNSGLNASSSVITPGPGKYDVDKSIRYIKVKVPCYSIKGKLNQKRNLITPGPGQYECNQNNLVNSIETSRRLLSQGTISRSKRDMKFNYSKEETPGPGNYIYDEIKIKRNPTKYSIPQSKKDTSFIMNLKNPGPGAYSHSNFFGKGTAYSIRKATEKSSSYLLRNNLNYSNVGPGQYDLEGKYNNKSTQIGFKIGNSRRGLNQVQNENPGPGEYSNMEALSKENSKCGFTFSKSKKPIISVLSDSRNLLNTTSPGPGSYNLSSKLTHNNGYSFPKFIKIKKIESTPGPGQYNNDTSLVKSNAPAFVIGKSPNTSFLNINDNPGPGQYKYEQSSLLKRNNTSYIIGKEKKFKTNNEVTPGPGQYKIPCSIRDVNEYSIVGGRFDMNFKYI